ncbi:MAG: hypothetical protein Q7R56_00465 [Nanoarchaeota archaeon]|nr:hypothetical protein [Nanoarchaeota archaeon]
MNKDLRNDILVYAGAGILGTVLGIGAINILRKQQFQDYMEKVKIAEQQYKERKTRVLGFTSIDGEGLWALEETIFARNGNQVLDAVEALDQGKKYQDVAQQYSSGITGAVLIRRLRTESTTDIYKSIFPGITLTNWWWDRSSLGKMDELTRQTGNNPEAVYHKEPLFKQK